jgi:putative SOS response-associated peptidase YedK
MGGSYYLHWGVVPPWSAITHGQVFAVNRGERITESNEFRRIRGLVGAAGIDFRVAQLIDSDIAL